MVFSDLFFLFVFLPAFALCYLLASRGAMKYRNAVLVAFSLLFYAWGEPVYVFLMLASVAMNYLIGLAVDSGRGMVRRFWLTVGVLANIGVIGVFKYMGFIAQVLADCGVALRVPELALPIGISFYTFQSVSYLVDVYRREWPVQRSFANLLLYISMFPQLIAGPIVRYGTVARQITSRHTGADHFADGLYRFLIGLGKKVILANQLSEVSDQFLTDGLDHLTTAGAWIGIVAFTLQIYFDFSGYSDMAIGLGRCLGFHFPENFNHPYCCRTITDFWRRWHMSLGSFFRDYVYIPLGGNRRHQWVNILIVWFLTGLWHGASWNFVWWGIYFGVIVTVEKYTLLRHLRKVPRLLLHIYSLLLVVIGWGIFYFDDTESMAHFFRAFFFGAPAGLDFVAERAFTDHFWLWVAAVLFCLPVRSACSRALTAVLGRVPLLHGLVRLAVHLCISVVLLVVSVALLVGATNNAFIYTRF